MSSDILAYFYWFQREYRIYIFFYCFDTHDFSAVVYVLATQTIYSGFNPVWEDPAHKIALDAKQLCRKKKKYPLDGNHGSESGEKYKRNTK